MPSRTNHRPTYTTTGPAAGQQRLDFDAAPEPIAPAPHVEEAAPEYGFKDGYRNPYKRVVNWVILDPHGTELATVTTKKGAKELTRRLNAKGGQDEAARGASR